MDNPEPQFNPQPDREYNELNDRYDSIQYVVNAMLILLTFLAAVLTAFLVRQQSDKGFELGIYSVQATNFIAQFHHGPEEAAQNEFLRKLTEYSRTHPDFLPILAKYGLKPASTTAGALPSAATPSAPASGAMNPSSTKK